MTDRLKDTILAAAQGRPELVLKGGAVVNVFTGEISRADVAVYGGTIIGVGEYSGGVEIECSGKYVCPGFIDSHLHIESSMVTPPRFASVVIPQGTTTLIADPHEIANVLGVKGIRYMLLASRSLPLRIYYMLPSCVPCTSFEHSGAVIKADDMRLVMGDPMVLGLGEVMDFPAVTGADPDMLAKLGLFNNAHIDGHAPGASGNGLNAYCVAGPVTDHESVTYEEIKEKLARGMYILLRVGSAEANTGRILERIAKEGLPTERMMFCTDDKHIEDIRVNGHINCIAAMAVKAGISAVDAVRMGTINAARAFGLKRTGAVAPGYRADLVVIDDLIDFKVSRVILNGCEYAGIAEADECPGEVLGTVVLPPLRADDLRLEAKGMMPAIEIVPGQIANKLAWAEIDGDEFTPSGELAKVAVIERHRASGSMAVGIVKGFGIKRGAIASTVGHDSHNLVALGMSDADMLKAIEALRECEGGYAVVCEGELLARLPLPVAGLMTSAGVDETLGAQRELLSAAKKLGIESAADPFILMSFLALPVIPEARMTDMGFFDVVGWKFLYKSRDADV